MVYAFTANLADVSDESDTEMPDAWRDKQSTSRKPESHKNFGNKRGKHVSYCQLSQRSQDYLPLKER